jgi:hypothetical protein
MNALKWGFYARSTILPGEPEELYKSGLNVWISEHAGEGASADAGEGSPAFFAATAFDASWKYRRCVQAQDALARLRVNQARRAETPDEDETLQAELIARNLYKQPLDRV